jgi:predicted RNase H-like HicB family nuclease
MTDNKADRFSTVLQFSEEDGGWIATIPELPGASAYGDTPEEAVRELQTAKEVLLDAYRQDGCPIPNPDLATSASGQIRLRMPKSLHNALSTEAKKEGVSLNTYLVTILSARHQPGKILYDIKPSIMVFKELKTQLAAAGAVPSIPGRAVRLTAKHILKSRVWKR